MKKSGFAVLIGRSNVGKSTLMNTIIGSKIAITTPKPQTTRLPVQGILTTEESQIVFVDTPGVLKGEKDALSKALARSVKEALEEVDVVAYVVDPTREIGQEERSVINLLKDMSVPKILVINKIDIPNKPFLEFYQDLAEDFDHKVELSALKGTHVGQLKEIITELMPEGDFYYPEHQLTNMPNTFWLAELIREKLYLRLRQEVPYSTHVEVHEVEQRENGMQYIRATVFTNDNRYKSMIIGKQGRGIKEIGQAVRKELELVMQSKVFIDLQVEVDPHWMLRFE